MTTSGSPFARFSGLRRAFARGAAGAALFALAGLAQAAPPYSGTLYLAPNLITAADPTEYAGVASAGQGVRPVFGRRTNASAY